MFAKEIKTDVIVISILCQDEEEAKLHSGIKRKAKCSQKSTLSKKRRVVSYVPDKRDYALAFNNKIMWIKCIQKMAIARH